MNDFSSVFTAYQQGMDSVAFGDACAACGVYPKSVNPLEGGLVCMADVGNADILLFSPAYTNAFHGKDCGAYAVAPLSHDAAEALRFLLPFTRPIPALSRPQSCGVGDRLGIAGDGLLRAFAGSNVTPVLA